MERGVTRDLIHGTAIVIDGRAVLLLGESGAGKTDLAFRAITQPVLLDGRLVSAMLLSDDQVRLERIGETIIAHAPETIRGLIELRGLGIASLASIDRAPLALVVRLAPSHTIERLPDEASIAFFGLQIPAIAIDPAKAGAVARIVMAVAGRIKGVGGAEP